MNQILIGQFIKECRKEQGLTQEKLAEKLNISYKTVSKWECGNGLPDVSLMQPLCELLHISVNELLSGCRIEANDYRQKAEENLTLILQERKDNKKKIVLSLVIAFIMMLAAITLILLAGLLEMSPSLRIILICIALLIIILSIGVCCVLDRDSGYFECKYCHHLFIPSMSSYVAGPHTITRRYLKCPVCGKSSYCKKRLSK